jgi:hypothetical protein
MSEKKSGEPPQFKVSRVLIVSAAAVVFSVLLFFFFKGDPQQTEAAPSDTSVAQSTSSPERPAPQAAADDRQSEESARKVLTGLRRVQDATDRNISYEEYDQMLTGLNADLNSTLPTFVRHDEKSESFRQEVAGALRDYTAAQNWWKTVIRNSQVLTEDDRTSRLKAEWGSAQTHIDNAEKLLQAETAIDSDH